MRGVARVGHAVVDHQIRKIAEPQQPGLFLAQFQNLRQQRAIVMRRSRGPRVVSMPHLSANGGVIQIGHQGGVARPMQGEAPTGLVLRFGGGARGGHRGGRQSGQLLFVFDKQIVGVSRIQHVLRKLGGHLGERDVDFLEPGFAFRRQVRTVALERIDGLGEVAFHRAGQRPGLSGYGIALDRLPQTLIERQAGVECTHLGLDRIERRTQLRRGGDTLQMPDHVHCVLQTLGHGVQREQRLRTGDGFVEAARRIRQQFVDRGLDLRGLDFVEGYTKGNFK